MCSTVLGPYFLRQSVLFAEAYQSQFLPLTGIFVWIGGKIQFPSKHILALYFVKIAISVLAAALC